MSNCPKCKKRNSVNNLGLQCNGPRKKKKYHSDCGGLSNDIFKTLSSNFENISWICKTCKSKRQSVVISDARPSGIERGKKQTKRKKETRQFCLLEQFSNLKEENTGLKEFMNAFLWRTLSTLHH
jgi:hypothetical protein